MNKLKSMAIEIRHADGCFHGCDTVATGNPVIIELPVEVAPFLSLNHLHLRAIVGD